MKRLLYIFGLMILAQSCVVVAGPSWGYHHHWYPYYARPQFVVMLAGTQTVDDASTLASDYGITNTAAGRILEVTQSSDLGQSAVQLGFSTSDVIAMSNFEMPSMQGLAQVSQTLGVDQSKMNMLISELLIQVRAEMSDVNSDYWKGCTTSGHWRTILNQNCSSTATEGCAPPAGEALACSS